MAWACAALVFGLAASMPLLRAAGWFLIREDPLRRGAAILVLDGGVPFREMEAASLYVEGWAPRVLIVRAPPPAEDRALASIGIDVPDRWSVRREVLIRRGVPTDSILTTDGIPGGGTREELLVARQAVAKETGPLIVVSSRYHGRRVGLSWRQVAGTGADLVVHAARQDTFDPDHWWQDRRTILSVAREYLALPNLAVGLPPSAS
jgi:uncharacterized SAM-binding protein YcdF (DUF218 family)